MLKQHNLIWLLTCDPGTPKISMLTFFSGIIWMFSIFAQLWQIHNNIKFIELVNLSLITSSSISTQKKN
jgi:hypothetical protein